MHVQSCCFACLRDCLHGGGGPQVGEVTRLGGVTRLAGVGFVIHQIRAKFTFAVSLHYD